MQQATIFAVMQDGTLIVEFVEGFWQFIDIVLGFKADPDCIHLSWVVGGEKSVEEAYAHSRIEAEAIRAIIARASAALPEKVDLEYRESLAAFIERRKVQAAALELAESIRDRRGYERDMAALPVEWPPINREEARSYGLAVA